jgi:short-subunit dehydrogenase
MEIAGAGILLTGASSGIGAVTATTLAGKGARLVIVARRKDLLEEVAAQCVAAGGPEPTVVVADLADLDVAEQVALEADCALGGVDVLVNNAGVPKRRHIRDLSFGEVTGIMNINYFSPVRMTMALLPRMVDRARGRIVMMGSLAGRIGAPREAAYAGSKFALAGWSESVAVDLDGTGVSICTIAPAAIESPIWDPDLPDNERSLFDGEMLPASDVADVVVDLIENGGFERFVPPEMAQVIATKHQDVDRFVKGNAAYVRQRLSQQGA